MVVLGRDKCEAAKVCLRNIDTRKLADSLLSTKFGLVKQSLNDRPITPVGPESIKLEALTPIFFF